MYQKAIQVLLKECLYVLNEIPNKRLARGCIYPNTYALASGIEAVLQAAKLSDVTDKNKDYCAQTGQSLR